MNNSTHLNTCSPAWNLAIKFAVSSRYARKLMSTVRAPCLHCTSCVDCGLLTPSEHRGKCNVENIGMRSAAWRRREERIVRAWSYVRAGHGVCLARSPQGVDYNTWIFSGAASAAFTAPFSSFSGFYAKWELGGSRHRHHPTITTIHLRPPLAKFGNRLN